jgi:hypothetical protein
VNAEESWRFYHRLVGASAAAWLKAPQERMDAWAVTSVLDGIVDLNRDGLVDAEENRLSAEALRGPHPVESGFDQRIDFNANGQVEWFEINRAQHAGRLPLREEELPRKLPSQTAIDRYLDLNEDGTVGREELDRIARMLYDPETAELPPGWRELLDLDKNGRLSREELLKSWELYFRPHPATTGSQLDRRLDRNGNGFVEPDEIGIAAGRSQGLIFAALDQRVERLAWQKAGSPGEVRVTGQDEQPRFQSEYYQRLGLIQDRKLAVVGITSGTRSVDEETASGVMVFIEHSFVNVGKVRVVDRQNIAKIVKEYEFQQSELTDEATAVRIGKLSGADIIVIGSISYVGEIYYLNIKLISVETGEIIGSSIADANGPKEFYGMCNEAVYSLF